MPETNEKSGKNREQKTPSSGEKIDKFSELMTEWLDGPVADKAIRNQTRRPRQRSIEFDQENQKGEDTKNLGGSDSQNFGNVDDLESFAQGLELGLDESPGTFEAEFDNKIGIPIGDFENTRILLEMDPDGLEVAVTSLTLGDDGPPPGVEEIKETLRTNYKVISGINDKAIRSLIKKASKGEINKPIVIARSRKPKRGHDGRINYSFLEGTSIEIPPDGAKIYEALEKEAPRSVLQLKLKTFLVAPEQIIAEIVHPTQGVDGQDVFGNPISANGQHPEKILAGANVVEDGDRFIAKIFGYPCLVEDTLHVISPIWVSKDKMKAIYIHFSQAGDSPPPQSNWIFPLLQNAGIKHGIIETAIEKVCLGTAGKTRRAIILARGEPAENGIDSHFKASLDFEDRPGKVLEDGSIDFRDRNIITSVSEGQILGEYHRATPAKMGIDLMGNEITARHGQHFNFSATEGIRTVEEGDITRFYSVLQGSVHKTETTISVLPVMTINGDIDYEVGNIETDADVQIQGTVRTGFSIRSGGNILIGGQIENGANVWADGDIGVSQAIVGGEARVISGGNVECKYIQNSQVKAEGDIRVGSYVYNARVHAGGSIDISTFGGKKAGTIVGGETFAGLEINCENLGSLSYEYTRVGSLPPPMNLALLKRKRDTIAANKEQIKETLSLLNVSKLDPGQVNVALANYPQSQRPELIDAFKKATKAARALGSLEAEIVQLQNEGREVVAASTIKVRKNVYPDVEIVFGNKSHRVIDKEMACQFVLFEEEITSKPIKRKTKKKK